MVEDKRVGFPRSACKQMISTTFTLETDQFIGEQTLFYRLRQQLSNQYTVAMVGVFARAHVYALYFMRVCNVYECISYIYIQKNVNISSFRAFKLCFLIFANILIGLPNYPHFSHRPG